MDKLNLNNFGGRDLEIISKINEIIEFCSSMERYIYSSKPTEAGNYPGVSTATTTSTTSPSLIIPPVNTEDTKKEYIQRWGETLDLPTQEPKSELKIDLEQEAINEWVEKVAKEDFPFIRLCGFVPSASDSEWYSEQFPTATGIEANPSPFSVFCGCGIPDPDPGWEEKFFKQSLIFDAKTMADMGIQVITGRDLLGLGENQDKPESVGIDWFTEFLKQKPTPEIVRLKEEDVSKTAEDIARLDGKRWKEAKEMAAGRIDMKVDINAELKQNITDWIRKFDNLPREHKDEAFEGGSPLLYLCLLAKHLFVEVMEENK